LRGHGKSDSNQSEIVKALRGIGCFVEILSDVGRGCPDLLVAIRQKLYLMEVKAAGGKLTDEQVRWHTACKAPVHVVHSIAEAFEVILG
jgi:hypothetical protein